jgi:uncharacterized protein (TIGR02453 family)
MMALSPEDPTMPDPFADLIPDARAFLTRLAQNNNRDWFTAHKEEYEATLKRPALLLLDQLAAQLNAKGEQTVTTKLFRPHRDVRFSKDKTPYNTHLHMLWQVGKAALFFGVAPGYVSFGGGVMAFDKEQLTAWRAALDSDRGGDIADLSLQLATKGYTPDAPELKRVPAPYDKDHPRAGLLRHKSFKFWRQLPEQDQATPLTALQSGAEDLAPLLRLLNSCL